MQAFFVQLTIILSVVSKLKYMAIRMVNFFQVIIELARSTGYDVLVNSKRRTSWMNYKGYALNVKRRTPSLVLREKKKELIDSGSIDVGKAIVTIEYDVIKIDSDGKLVSFKYIAIH